MTRILPLVAFLAGLAAVAWVAAGTLAQPLALAVVALIAALYLAGALELRRFRDATASLARALDGDAAPPSLDAWLAPLHPSLRTAVRLRVEGERVPLPGPALAPTLAGLLVLLGMLGTFLGMVVTLDRTGRALQGATDLAVIRDSLSAPVKGLGLAFGTSVAGVAASAMLGLMSALARRERLQAAQGLDAAIASRLRGFSRTRREEASFQLMQQQADALPRLVDRLQHLMDAMERRAEALDGRLLAAQDRFHAAADERVAALSASVDRSLQVSLAESARVAGETLKPLAESTLAGLARENAAWQAAVADQLQQRVDAISARLEATGAEVAQAWQRALAEQHVGSQALSRELREASLALSQRLDERAAALADGIGGRLEVVATQLAQAYDGATSRQAQAGEAMVERTAHALDAAAAAFERQLVALQRQADEAEARRLGEREALEAQRLQAWQASLSALAASLREEWQRSGEQTLARQQQLCDVLAETAGRIAAQAESHAGATIAEIERLVQVAAEAPRAAAEVIGGLRQQLSESLARDQASLQERERLLATLSRLLDEVNHASGAQREAIDALVSTSAGLLERLGERFADETARQSEAMGMAVAQVAAGAAEVGSLGEALGFAVQRFGESNDALLAQLQRIESALGATLARSDEQLAYYVAQAREVIDLSIGAQKQVVEDLQRLASGPALAGSPA